MKKFPAFFTTRINPAAHVPDPSLQGPVFEGKDGLPIVFWRSKNGGVQPEQIHDFWEYAL